MPLTGKDRKVEGNFEREYGPEQGKRAFYASINAGKVKGIPEATRMAKKRKHHRHKKRHSRRR
jgi:hypothetical protein